jgi:hypothetical protein
VEDGLSRPWDASKIYVNTPFASLAEWGPKIRHEAGVLYQGKRKEIFQVALVPYRETEWMKNLLPHANLVLIPHRKPLFWTAHRKRVSVRDPVALLYFGDKAEEVATRFRKRFQVVAVSPVTVAVGPTGSTYNWSGEKRQDAALEGWKMPEADPNYDPVTEVHIGDKNPLMTLDRRAQLEALIRKY